MPNDEYVMICPYYRKIIGNSIYCDGIASDENIPITNCLFKQEFTERRERNKCIKKYCSGFRYHDCRIAVLNDVLNDKK